MPHDWEHRHTCSKDRRVDYNSETVEQDGSEEEDTYADYMTRKETSHLKKKHGPRSRIAVRAESMIRTAISKMRARNQTGLAPGSATSQSITNLIAVEYGWPQDVVHKRVERALDRALKSGRIVECKDQANKVKYSVADTDVQKHLKEFRRNPTKKRMKILRDLGTLLGDEIDANFDFRK